MTHEYQGRIQIFVISLVELLVILLGHLMVIFVESRADILRSRADVFLLAVGGVSAAFRRGKAGPTRLPVSHSLIRVPPSSVVPQGPGCSLVLAKRSD